MNEHRLYELLDELLEDRLDETDRAELVERLRASDTAREAYWEFVQQDVLLQDLVRESAGRDLARMALGESDSAEVLLQAAENRETPGRPNSSRLHARLHARWSWSFATACVILLSAIVVGYSYFAPPGPSGDPASEPRIRFATLRSLNGDVSLIAPGREPVKVTSGQAFALGDAVAVGEASEAVVTLEDGSQLLLSADSLARFASVDGTLRCIHLERGGAEVDAAPQSPDRPLVFTTGQARLTVLGTRFRLYAGGEDSRVELEEGKVRFERQADGQSVEVAAGQYAVASTAPEPSQPLVAQPLRTEWKLRHTLLRAGHCVVFSHDEPPQPTKPTQPDAARSTRPRLATASGSRIQVWDANTGTLSVELTKVPRYNLLAFTPTNEAIVALNESGQVAFWRLNELAAHQGDLKLEQEQGRLRHAAVSRDGRWIAQTTSVDPGHLPIWRVDESGAFRPAGSAPMKAGGVAIAATAAGPHVVASAWGGSTRVWHAESRTEVANYQFDLQLHVMALSLDGRWLAGFGNRAGLVLVDRKTGERRSLWPSDSVHVASLCFTRDGGELIAGMADGVVRAWSTEAEQSLFVLPTGDTHLESLDISDDEQWLAVAGDAGRVTVWHSEAGVQP